MERITDLKFQKLSNEEMKMISGGRVFWGNETTLSPADGLDRCSSTTTHYICWISTGSSSDSVHGDSTGDPVIL